MVRIEKRIPFGFRGEWGKVYKLYTYEEKTEQGIVKWDNGTYADIGQDVQFKYMPYGTDKQTNLSQPVLNILRMAEYRVVKTTDAYFDEKSMTFKCIVQPGDIVYLFGEWYTVDKVEEESIYVPKKHTFYYAALKNIEKEKLTFNA